MEEACRGIVGMPIYRLSSVYALKIRNVHLKLRQKKDITKRINIDPKENSLYIVVLKFSVKKCGMIMAQIYYVHQT